ncbi:MAG: glycosyltransferase family 39 protein [Gemmatimonadetes bacterium]|nr:glycosyltransferase family 39 protein [Gemmatimonadota bacterium]
MTPAIPPIAEPAPTASSTLSWSRSALGVLALVLALGCFVAWRARAAVLTIGGDDATYLTLAQSLSTGHYRDEFLVGTPPHAQYPPGYPLWLLLIRLVAGSSLDAAFGANILLVALTALLAADAMRRLGSPRLGVVSAAMVVFNPHLMMLASELRSEVLFVALSAVALWASLRAGANATRGAALLACTAAVAAFLTRSVGITVIPAVIAALLAGRQWRRAALGAVAAGVVTVGWFRYTAWAASQSIGHSYANDLARLAAPNAAADVAQRALVNLEYYFVRLAAVPFGLPDLPNQPLDNGILGGLLLVLMAVGGWSLRRRWPALPLYLAMSLGVLLLFPWAFTRFVTALYPWLAICALLGIWQLLDRATRGRGERAALVFGVGVACCAVVTQAEAARLAQSCRATGPYADPRCYDPETRGVITAIRYIAEMLPADAIVATSKPSTVFVMSGRRTVPLDPLAGTAAPLSFTSDFPATHLLLTRLMPYESGRIAPRLRAACTSLTLLHASPPALVIGPRRPGDGAPDACTGLDRYLADTQPNYERSPR